jgi:glucose/mannose-6-phosphate isomerase
MRTYATSLQNFTEQFDYVLNNYSEHGVKIQDLNHVILGGLGGSGITAELAKSWFYDKCPVPIETVHNYFLPSYVSEKSLVVLSSYSGNTEETLSLLEQALSANARIITLSSGGMLREKAEENNLKHILLPEGYQPRMTFGMGLGFHMLILGELLEISTREDLEKSRERFANEQEKQIDSARQIYQYFVTNLKQKFVIVADNYFEGVAMRFAQQINENVKLEAYIKVVPEANQNVIESYTDKLPTNFLLIFSEDHPRIAARFDLLNSHLEIENNKVLPLIVPK